MHVFLGITGASGAPYAARLLEALAAADCEIGVCASRAGDRGARHRAVRQRAALARRDARAAPRARAGAATLYDPRTGALPTPRGSAKVDAYVICPCSMGTLGTIASGAMQNLIHRAASVAMKEERQLVLDAARDAAVGDPPAATCSRCARPAPTILFLAPGFYHGAETVDDLVDFVVARASTSSASRTP